MAPSYEYLISITGHENVALTDEKEVAEHLLRFLREQGLDARMDEIRKDDIYEPHTKR